MCCYLFIDSLLCELVLFVEKEETKKNLVFVQNLSEILQLFKRKFVFGLKRSNEPKEKKEDQRIRTLG